MKVKVIKKNDREQQSPAAPVVRPSVMRQVTNGNRPLTEKAARNAWQNLFAN